jgi:hypothetical protein
MMVLRWWCHIIMTLCGQPIDNQFRIMVMITQC